MQVKGPTRPLFYFRHQIQLLIEKSIDIELGIWTCGRRVAGTDVSTELCFVSC